MTSREQRKLKKRKEREKENRQHLLKNREKIRAVVREEREEMRREKRIKKLARDLERFEQYMPLDLADDATLTQIEKNVQILKTLEIEYAEETDQKKELNEKLERQGFLTLEEKLEATHRLLAEKADAGVGGSAVCKVSVNKPDTAEVSVTKAPNSENS